MSTILRNIFSNWAGVAVNVAGFGLAEIAKTRLVFTDENAGASTRQLVPDAHDVWFSPQLGVVLAQVEPGAS